MGDSPKKKTLTMRYDTTSYLNVRSKADLNQLIPPHATEKLKSGNKRKSKNVQK